MARRKIKVANIVGTRPNFIKIFPILREMDKSGGFSHTLIHTGQHHDSNMSDIFFKEFGIKEPEIKIDAGGGSHSEQTGKIMTGLEKAFMDLKPDLVLVVGDVNSTLAATLAAVKLHIAVAHVEAGLRSFDRTMPEEINRIITDRFAEFLFVTSEDAIENLKKEGIKKNKIYFTGNVMIDTLLTLKKQIIKDNTILKQLGIEKNNYCYLTLHRPSNVDNKEQLKNITRAISKISRELNVVFPIHPRTRKMLVSFSLENFLKE
jgi:UDP-N-acetylglucosamine 2-epimerase (non-hydrolysing)